jgi:hypothetical protein
MRYSRNSLITNPISMFIVNKKNNYKVQSLCTVSVNSVYMPVKGVGVAINLQDESTSLALSLAW